MKQSKWTLLCAPAGTAPVPGKQHRSVALLTSLLPGPAVLDSIPFYSNANHECAMGMPQEGLSFSLGKAHRGSHGGRPSRGHAQCCARAEFGGKNHMPAFTVVLPVFTTPPASVTEPPGKAAFVGVGGASSWGGTPAGLPAGPAGLAPAGAAPASTWPGPRSGWRRPELSPGTPAGALCRAASAGGTASATTGIGSISTLADPNPGGGAV